MNHDQPADPRQHALTGALRCFYDAPRHRKLRPDCDGVAVVAYGPTTLCASCDLRRSTVGKGTAPRAVPGFELGRLIDAARTAAHAERQLAHAAHAARQAGASWTQIGDALGLTRQAAQQRWGPALKPMHPDRSPRSCSDDNDTPPHRHPATPTGHFQTSHDLGHNDSGPSEDMTSEHPERLMATTDQQRR